MLTRPFGLAICLSLSLIAGWSFGTARADTADDLALQEDRQKQIQAETDSMVRRLGTMLRVLDYYQLDKSGERHMLEEMAGVLSGLSTNQMAEVIRRLEAAAKTKDEAVYDKDIQKAYDRHREILDSLKNLLARHDAVRSLDQAADRLDKMAKDQLEQHLQTKQLIKDSTDPANPDISDTSRFPFNRRRNFNLEPKRHADAQFEIGQEVGNILRQVNLLKAQVPDEQKERIVRSQTLAAKYRLLDNLELSSRKLRAYGSPALQSEVWLEVNEAQWQSAGHIKELARALRGSPDLLAALREAQARIDHAIAKQDEINKETKSNEKDTPVPAKVRDLAKEQARAEYDTRDVANLVKPHVQELAKEIERAEQAMREARAALDKNQPKEAIEPQSKAAQALEDIRQDLDKLIAAAETQKNDPLVALKKAADDLEKLIKDQTDTRDKTKETKQNQKAFPELAKNQKELANRTEQLKNTPLPTKESQDKGALDKAQKAMTEAARALQKQKAENAVPKQEQALKALEEAKKAFAEKIAEMEKRKEDLANLEEAAKKLAELTKAENDIADQAKEMAAKSESKKASDLAKTQGKLTPQAKEVAKKVEAAAPDAAKKVNDSTINMEAAKKELDKNKADPASKEAKEAAKKLAEAQQALAKAMDALKAKDIADQAAMQPNKLDPQAAARQIAKALEQTQKAQEQARQAQALARQDQKRQQDRVDLAKLQENIGTQADRFSLPDPARDAFKAAADLKRAEIAKALDNQAKALGKFEDAAQQPPPSALPLPLKLKPDINPGESKDFNSKGAPPAVAKANQAQHGVIKNLAKSGGANPGAAKAGPIGQGQRPAETKDSSPQTAEGKTSNFAEVKAGPAMLGETKSASAHAAQSKTGQGTITQAKAGDPDAGDGQPEDALAKAAQSAPLPQAKNVPELAQMQKEVMDATKALLKSQDATESAMAALGQAQAQAPQAVQKQLQNAGKQLAKANQSLQKGQPGQAGDKQAQAAKELSNALKAMNAALAGMKKSSKPPGDAQAKADQQGKDGMGEEGMGDEGMDPMGQGKQGQAKKPGQAKGKQPGSAKEKNDNLGDGNRVADGRTDNPASRLNDVSGDGSFLHLPPRQRELIRQALSGQLPPEYAAMIQQYYMNLARGRAVPAPDR